MTLLWSGILVVLVAAATVLADADAHSTDQPAARAKQPHILLVVADDFGWSTLGVHRRNDATASAQARAEAVVTPTLDALADDGVLLTHHMAYKICAPSRAALHSGRLPTHVNTENTAQSAHNPRDPVSGFAGVPRNMTTLGTKMRDAGYKTVFIGKPVEVTQNPRFHHDESVAGKIVLIVVVAIYIFCHTGGTSAWPRPRTRPTAAATTTRCTFTTTRKTTTTRASSSRPRARSTRA